MNTHTKSHTQLKTMSLGPHDEDFLHKGRIVENPLLERPATHNALVVGEEIY